MRTIIVKSSTHEGRIRKYLHIIYNFHKLTDKEIDILVELIVNYQLIELKYPTVKDPELFNRLLFDPTVTKKIKEKLQIKDSIFQNYMTTFRRKKVIEGRVLNPNFIPPKETFDLTFRFI